VIGAVVTRTEGFERRARVTPWGIEVQVWRLVDTITIPGTAATLPLNALFPAPDISGAVPAANNDDEKTLENVIDGPPAEDAVELVCSGGVEASGGGAASAGGQGGRGRHDR
jgi:hypothetical protein